MKPAVGERQVMNNEATLLAWLSSPAGKIILAESVLICFHFSEGGCRRIAGPEQRKNSKGKN